MPARTYTSTEKKGVIAVEALAAELGWICRVEREADFGIDARIEITDELQQPTGQAIAVQIKSGPSYFQHGDHHHIWRYTEPAMMDYWEKHSVPVILVLHDTDKGVTYWVHAAKTSAKRTGKSWRLNVPRSQLLSPASKDALIALAERAVPFGKEGRTGTAQQERQVEVFRATVEAAAADQTPTGSAGVMLEPPTGTSEAAFTEGHTVDASVLNMTIGQIVAKFGTHPASSIWATTDVDTKGEDQVLHEKITAYRDIKNEGQPRLAYTKLEALLQLVDPQQTPHAYFRIKTNLASAALELGREAEAADGWKAAYHLDPTNPLAASNLALAYLVEEDVPNAVKFARRALALSPPPASAVSVLLQGLARDDQYEGDGESEIPTSLKDTPEAVLGLIEFYRLRDDERWPALAIDAESRFEQEAFKRAAALARLKLFVPEAARSPQFVSAVSRTEVLAAGRVFKELVERWVTERYENTDELEVAANNAAVGLRVGGASEEAKELLQAVLRARSPLPTLSKMLAVVLMADGDMDGALKAADEAPDDAEALLLKAEMVGQNNPAKGYEIAAAIEEETLAEHFRAERWVIAAELAHRAKNDEGFADSVAQLRKTSAPSFRADLLEVEHNFAQGTDLQGAQAALRNIADNIPNDAPLLPRLSVALALFRRDLAYEASAVLEPVVDVSVLSAASVLYLQSLAKARRDTAFLRELERSSDELRSNSEVLFASSAHAYNCGDLEFARTEVRKLLKSEEDNLPANILLLEILVRSKDQRAIDRLLTRPLEDLPSTGFSTRARLSRMMFAAGYRLRALALSYRLYLEFKDRPQASMSLAGQVLESTRGDSPIPPPLTVVAEHAAVSLKLGSGEHVTFVVEPSVELRQFSANSWPTDHELVQAAWGLSEGETFKFKGLEATVGPIFHKYVFAMREVMEQFSLKYGEERGLKKITVEVEREGGLDEVIAQARARHEYVRAITDEYKAGRLTLAAVAMQAGISPIDVMDGLRQAGAQLRNAHGGEPERTDAAHYLALNGQKGCVIDAPTFWTAWRLNAADVIEATCGKLHISRGTLDSFRFKLEELETAVVEGAKHLGYADGGLTISEASGEEIRPELEQCRAAYVWLNEHAEICPVHVPDDIPASLARGMGILGHNLFDEILIAREKGVLLLTDDLYLRQLARELGVERSAWLQWALAHAFDLKLAGDDAYTDWTVQLVALGQSYVAVSAELLLYALDKDRKANGLTAGKFEMLARALGGASAEPISHLRVIATILNTLWTSPDFRDVREHATSILLRRLLVARPDWQLLVRAIQQGFRFNSALHDYLTIWAKGHFVL